MVVTLSAAPTCRVSARVADCDAASVTRSVTAKLPFAVGVPLTTPAPLRFTPGGRLPDAIDQLYGVTPPVAATVWL